MTQAVEEWKVNDQVMPVSHTERMDADHGSFYHIELSLVRRRALFTQRLEKAIFLAALQDHFSPRTRMETGGSRPRLVAYALIKQSARLLLYASHLSHVFADVERLVMTYDQYVREDPTPGRRAYLGRIRVLDDIHEALETSRLLHISPAEWRDDRYSSIGFYLDDRRGDWIEPWRLVELYGNDPSWYLAYLEEAVVAMRATSANG